MTPRHDTPPLDTGNTWRAVGHDLERFEGSTGHERGRLAGSHGGETFRGDELGGGEGESSRPATSSRQEWQRLTARAIADLAGRQRPAPATPIEEQS